MIGWEEVKAWLTARTATPVVTVKQWAGSAGVVWSAIAFVAMLVVAGAFVLDQWESLFESEVPSASLRNLFIVLAAIIGVPLAIWRSAVAKQQANASERQAETGEKRLKNEIYEKGAAMLGDDVPSVRLGGIYSLKALANESPLEYQVQVMELLCAFVRNPPEEEADTKRKASEGENGVRGLPVPRVLRDDVQTVVDMIVKRANDLNEGWRSSEGYQLDLRGASLESVAATGGDLSGALLHGATLDRGHFAKATLSGAQMTAGSMQGADVSAANMNGCRFHGVNLKGIVGNGVDLSHCSMNGVDLVGALLLDAKLSNCSMTGTSLRKARMQGAKLDHCHITNCDFTEAYLWRADVSATKFGIATRVTVSEDESTSETLYCILTQQQLDEALAHPDYPPEIEEGTMDAQTGEALIWRGGCITVDQFPQIHGPQQIVKDGALERKQGAFLEWKEMGVRLVSAVLDRLRSGGVNANKLRVCEFLEQEKTTGCGRVTFVGRKDSGVDSCGIRRWDGEGRIWMLFVYQEEGMSEEHSDLSFFDVNGPESEPAWERWLNNIDWTIAPILESGLEPVEIVPPHRRAMRA